MCWKKYKNKFYEYSINGFSELDLELPVTHISYYEADALQGGLERDLPTEFEWELCSKNFNVSGNFLESCNYHPISEKRIIVFVEMLELDIKLLHSISWI